MYLIFGGEQFYAHGGANDFLCTAEEGEAQLLAKNLIGTVIEYVEDWDKYKDCLIEMTIEWTQVVTKEGIIMHSFGHPYGSPNGVKHVNYLKEIGKCPIK